MGVCFVVLEKLEMRGGSDIIKRHHIQQFTFNYLQQCFLLVRKFRTDPTTL